MTELARTPDPHPSLRFGPDYRESVTLRDGHVAQLFILGAEHSALLERGFERLSPRSRYLRFMSGFRHLSDKQLRYLTETDGHRHLALAAGIAHADGTCEEAGVARFVQLPEDPSTVEAAITVIDAFQGIGLGTVLMERLVEAAREHGYRWLQAEILLENRTALHMLKKLGNPVSLTSDEGVAIAKVALSPGSRPPTVAL